MPTTRNAYGADHPQTLIVESNLVSALGNTGRADEAADLARSLAERSARINGATSQEAASDQHRLATMLLYAGRLDEAEAEAVRAVDVATAAVGADGWLTGQALVTRGLIRLRRGERPAARADLTRGRAVLVAAFGERHPRVAQADKWLSELAASN